MNVEVVLLTIVPCFVAESPSRQVAKSPGRQVARFVGSDYVMAMDPSGDIPCYLSLNFTRSGKLPALGACPGQFDAAGDCTAMQMQSARFPPVARTGFSASQVPLLNTGKWWRVSDGVVDRNVMRFLRASPARIVSLFD
ncbi:MAG: hypothetical protein GY904_03885 [Planctomycetaceae bacterium]|nr:hypothetical protein [Planctomycetaceae bacterium]